MSKMDLETPSVDTIRTLRMDALQAVDSGHPGTLLAHDMRRTVAAAKALHAGADRRNLYVADRRNVYIADRRNLFIKVTLLFSADRYRAVADAHLRGVERRVRVGHDPALAVGLDVYRAYREVMGSQCFQRLENAGARMRRPLRAGTRTKNPACSPRTGSARWSRSTSTACSPGGRSEGSTPSTSGASSSARCLLSRSARSSRA
ncbi:hypothetical protein ABT030_31110 [Streptomyces mirabilis]|uniref:hypothetical protein n=1 Tax=Streptomyces mirabilis TaxID=68239 RepID=UPI00331B4308